MTIRTKNRTLFAKTEAVYKTPEALVAADAIRTTGLTIRPFNAKGIDRNLDGPAFGSTGKIHTGAHVVIEFDVEWTTSSTAGTAPPYGHLFQACGMFEDIVAVTSVTYTPLSTALNSETMWFQLDGQRHAATGCRGTWTIKFDSQGIPYFHFVFTGIYIAPSTTADIAPDWTGWLTPRPVSFAHTPTFTLHGLASVFTKFSFDFGNDVQYFDNPGEEQVEIVGRMAKGSVSLKAPTLATKNYFETARADTIGDLILVHGTTAGRIITLDSDTVQLLEPNYGDDRGRATIEANLDFQRDVADDEMALIFT